MGVPSLSGRCLNNLVPGRSPPSCCTRGQGSWAALLSFGVWSSVWSNTQEGQMRVGGNARVTRCRCAIVRALAGRLPALRADAPPSLPLMLSLRACARHVAHSGARVRDHRSGTQVTRTCRALSLACLAMQHRKCQQLQIRMQSYMHLTPYACDTACKCPPLSMCMRPERVRAAQRWTGSTIRPSLPLAPGAGTARMHAHAAPHSE